MLIDLLSRAMRPFGMLIFLEGIAWFLLRQYRALLQDYKAFPRVYLKRSNYLIAALAYSEPATGERATALISAMLQDDLTAAYTTTSDASRNNARLERGPILEALKELTDSIPRISKS